MDNEAYSEERYNQHITAISHFKTVTAIYNNLEIAPENINTAAFNRALAYVKRFEKLHIETVRERTQSDLIRSKGIYTGEI